MTAIVWFDSAHSAVWNMAADKTLLEMFGNSATPILRFYYWIKPAVTCGKSQPIPTPGAVRRPTGGGIVQHGKDTAYTVILPVSHPWNKIRRDECYRKIHSIVAEALLQLGFENIRLQTEQSPVDDRGTMRCFVQPSKYDVMGENGKLAGAAQWKGKTGTLHQGSIATDDPRLPQAVVNAWIKAAGDDFIQFVPDTKFCTAIAGKLE